MIANWRAYICLFWIFTFFQVLRLQAQQFPITLDTILMINDGMGMNYYMGGRKVNLAIMEWFMHDYPAARKDIGHAVVTDQLSVVGYSVGSLFTVTGLLVYEPNERLGGNLLMLGGISLGTGIIFQLVSGKYKKRAVRKYNAALQRSRKPEAKGMGFLDRFGLTAQGLTFRF